MYVDITQIMYQPTQRHSLTGTMCIKRDSVIIKDSEHNPMPYLSPPHILDATSSPNEEQSVMVP